ncbi:chemotaxis protein CheX [Azospirillum canadense]|uniref:chemotaxis protein CheX n=1 Tax=Azospirillum canadense TaxID=403962 RepID=UPI0022272488|nr:chemotaxis protein CheX [Azospirillum canadense]MCW2243146.1 chemotaxis protein CheC [Azospirillum canadense]
MIDNVEHGALTALVNAGVARAATQLSQLTAEQVALSTRVVHIIPHRQAVELLPMSGTIPVVAVRERFSGRFSGSALLMFPETMSLGIVKAVVGDRTRIEEIEDLEPEALTEIGSVLLNGCLSILANSLRQTLNLSAPELLRGSGQFLLLGTDHRRADVPVLFVHVDFIVYRPYTEGYIALIMDLPAPLELKALLRETTDENS